MEGISTTSDRVEFLQDNYDLTKRNAQALILAELGYSASGISQELAVTEGTAKKYLSRLEDRIGTGVTESLPKNNRYSTFPGDTVHTEEAQVFSDVIDIPPVNRGVELSEIDAEQMSAPESYEGQNA
jgi:DNA-binding CsgD family transcriptional regulator